MGGGGGICLLFILFLSGVVELEEKCCAGFSFGTGSMVSWFLCGVLAVGVSHWVSLSVVGRRRTQRERTNTGNREKCFKLLGWYVLPALFEWVEVAFFLVSELAFPHEGVVFKV